MNKLEEQLRASRRTEVPGLKPPAGGWEAISGKLAAEAGAGAGAGTAGGTAKATGAAAGGSAVASTTTKAILLKWLTGLGVLLMVSSATFYLVMAASENTNDAEPITELVEADMIDRDQPAQNDPPEASPTKTSSDLREAPLREEGNTPAVLKGGKPTPITTERLASPRPVDGGTSGSSANSDSQQSSPIDADKPTSGRTAPFREPATTSTPPSSTKTITPPSPQPEVATSASRPETTGQQNETEPPAKTPATNTGQPGPASNFPEQPSAPVSQDDSRLSSDSQSLPSSATSPKPASLTAVNKLPPVLFPVSSSSDLLANKLLMVLPAPQAGLSTRRGKDKPRARAEWQLYGSASRYTSENPEASVYERDPTGQAGSTFNLPNEGLISADFQRISLRNTTQNSYRYAVGINRQTSSGFLFHSAVSFYYSSIQFDDSEVPALQPGQFLVDSSFDEVAIPVEIGVHYTFRKRYRFRPYLGVNLFNNIFYYLQRKELFIDDQNNQTMVNDSGGSSLSFTRLAGLSGTLGFQYKFSSKWSAGAYLWAGSDGIVAPEAPYGIEIRYRLK